MFLLQSDQSARKFIFSNYIGHFNGLFTLHGNGTGTGAGNGIGTDVGNGKCSHWYETGKGKNPGPIVSYCAGPVPCTCADLVPSLLTIASAAP